MFAPNEFGASDLLSVTGRSAATGFMSSLLDLTISFSIPLMPIVDFTLELLFLAYRRVSVTVRQMGDRSESRSEKSRRRWSRGVLIESGQTER